MLKVPAMTLSSREDELEQSQQTAGFPASGGASLPSRLTAKRALSEFTLIPATDVSKCCSAAAMFGAGASAAGAEGRVIEIPLFRGANCEGKSAASGGGGATCRAVNQLGFSSLGIPGDAKGASEKHIITSKTSEPAGTVLLDANGTISGRCSPFGATAVPSAAPLRTGSPASLGRRSFKRRLDLGPIAAPVVVLDDSDEESVSGTESVRAPLPVSSKEFWRSISVETRSKEGSGAQWAAATAAGGKDAESSRCLWQKRRKDRPPGNKRGLNVNPSKVLVLDLTNDCGPTDQSVGGSSDQPIDLRDSDDDDSPDVADGVGREDPLGESIDSSNEALVIESRTSSTNEHNHRTTPSPIQTPSKLADIEPTAVIAGRVETEPNIHVRMPDCYLTPCPTKERVKDKSRPKGDSPILRPSTREPSRRVALLRAAPSKRQSVDSWLRVRLVKRVGHDPGDCLRTVEELLSRGMKPPRGMCDAVVSALLKSRCSVQTQFLHRQLRAMLAVSTEWHPSLDGQAWLENVMLEIMRCEETTPPAAKNNRGEGPVSPPTSPAALEAHVCVLKLLLDFLVDARHRECERAAVGGEGSAAHADTLRLFFNLSAEHEGVNSAARRNTALQAVKKSAAWAVKVWGLGLALGGNKDVAAGRHEELDEGRTAGRDGRRNMNNAQAAACLLTARLLGEVVETCGLPATVACKAIREVMFAHDCSRLEHDGALAAAASSFASAEATIAETTFAALCVFDSSALCGLMRALSSRGFVKELARQLLNYLPKMDAFEGADSKRLRLLLERQAVDGGIGLVERFAGLNIT